MIRLARHAYFAVLATIIANPVTLAFGQVSETEPAEDKSYAMPYLVVLLLVVLGLMLVLRPSLRQREVTEKRKNL